MLLVEFNEKHKHNRDGCIFVVSGPSGCGKNTLIKDVLKKIPEIYYIPSITTRAMRQGESQCDPYIFISKERFEELIDRNELIEYEQIHDGSYYGTHSETYRYAINNGYDIIKDVDVNGALSLKKIFGDNIVLIFINVSSLEKLHQRLVLRGDSAESIDRRMQRAAIEIEKSAQFDCVFYNDVLEVATVQLEAYILKSLSGRQTG